jgi:hypothetical protein
MLFYFVPVFSIFSVQYFSIFSVQYFSSPSVFSIHVLYAILFYLSMFSSNS